MLRVQGDHHRRVFAALAFVNRQGVGQGQLIQLVKVVDDLAVVEADRQFLVLQVDAGDAADVAVEDVLVVVVDRLQYLVAGAKGPAEAGDFRLVLRRIEGLLQADVQAARAQLGAVHRRQDLYVVERIEPKTVRDALADEGEDTFEDGLGRGGIDDIEIAGAVRGGGLGPLTSQNAVGGADDPALLRLAENLGQAHHRDRAGGDDVVEHGARADGRKLIDIADEQKAGARRHRMQQLIHQKHVDHGRFIDDDEIGVEGPVAVAFAATGDAVELEQAVDGLGFAAGGFGEALGGAASRRRSE